MRLVVFASAVLLINGFSQAIAQSSLVCDGSDTVVPDTLVLASTVCVGSPGNWEGQEYHEGSSGLVNNLWDFKGGTDPNNKSEPVGSWSNSGDIFTYTYGPGSVFVTLYCRRADSSIYFVNDAGRKQNVTFVSAGNGC